MTRRDILDLFKYCKFDGELTCDNFEEAILDYLPEKLNCEYCYGVSKLVLLPKGANFVIKVPFNGTYETNYDEENDYFESVEFYENENACDDIKFYWDYCAAEAVLWRYARSCRVERAFCKTALVGFVKKHPIYIQERAITYQDRYKNNDFHYPVERSSKAKKSAEDIGLDCWWNPVWQTDLFEYYGEKQYQKIMKFIDYYDISDLHGDNLGYIGTRPVLIDYSSWRQ